MGPRSDFRSPSTNRCGGITRSGSIAAASKKIALNLIGNALKFTPAGGAIAMRAEAEDGFVRFSVSDTGSGIPRALLGRVFDRGVRGAHKGPGLGLGLTIAKGIVEAHGGRITVDSTPAGGSTFSFTLPIA